MDILEVTKQRSENEGRLFSEVLLEEIGKGSLPEPLRSDDCMTEVENTHFSQGTLLSEVRLNHIERCRWCQRILANSIHSGDGFWERLRNLQARAIQDANE